MKLVLTALSYCDSRDEHKKTVSISASNFAKVIGMDLRHAHTELYKVADKSDLDIKYETMSSGRRVVALSFRFEPAKQMNMNL